MQHVAEIAVHSFLRDVLDGKASMPAPVIAEVAADVQEALTKQFQDDAKKREFKLRMSNIGRPTCQLWMQKNHPDLAEAKPVSFKINMLIGDIVEAVFKGILRGAKVHFQSNDRVTLDLGNGKEISGEYDMVLDGKVDDIKSASPWSYDNKFSDFHTLNSDDTFGYVSQLVGYAKAADKEVGGWWVVNKVNGDFKYVSASEADTDHVLEKIEETYDYIDKDKPFERCFEAVPETYRGKASGNMKLCKTCGWCDYKNKCWPDLQALPSKVYKGGKTPPTVEYVSIASEETEKT